MEATPEIQAEYLANRLRKRDRHLRKWARREGFEAYRVYDRDIPEVPLAVDRYGDSALVFLYERPYEKAEDEERAWLNLMSRTVADALAVAPGKVFAKVRRRQRGLSQYDREAERAFELEVREGPCRFIVNLSDYLDTGLFLDHRTTRAMVRGESAGRKVLNLFSYTGAFTVHAAAGGAGSTTSVDLSNTYLDWTRRNLELNGFASGVHELVRADAQRFLAESAARGRKWDLAVLDPPTHSNSKKMDDDLDIGRDWPGLAGAALDVLEPGGVLWFSTNARRFRFDPSLLPGTEAADLTDATIPPDFRGRPHRVWRVVKRT
ncbi:MAG: class I SAM-dependent methyltransferase [Spirochaetales bacterium]|nr:class I SAM-dependent methyltransferase [Spirochaetales bacterium]